MSLTSVDSVIWNRIAEKHKLRTKWAEKAFRLGPDEMVELENREYREAKKASGHKIAAALMDMKPLLLENVAISQFSQEQSGLRDALPEVVSISEAVMLASEEYRLTPFQQRRLSKLLQEEMKRPSA